MKRKNLLIIVTVLTVALGTIAFSSQMQSAKQSTVSAATDLNGNPQVPTNILYDRMFRMVIDFRKKAEIQELKGERVTLMKTYFKDEAQLSDKENEVLEKVALDFVVEVQPIDDEAGELIGQIRNTFPDGMVSGSDQVSPPPPELEELQNRRNTLALSYRNKLSKSLGKKFGDFDNFIHMGFASNFRSIPSSSGPQK